uniref:Nucleolar protein 16 n=1 Tax=Timema shepardi TaxID=629360 RepID=A0A7R9B003_TIMSH|nr:unnamed protein product [Timema shepardi]
MKTPEKWKPKNKSKGLSDVSKTLDQHRNNLTRSQGLENSTQGQNARVNSENDNLSGHHSQRHDDIVCDSHLEIETTKKHGEETNREKNMEYILQPCVSREKIKQAKYLWDLRWSRWWGYNWRRKRNEIVRRKRVIISLEKPAGIINKTSLRDVNIFDDASIDQETCPFYDGESGCSGNDSSSHTQKTSSSRHDSKFRFKSLGRILHILSAQRTSFIYAKRMITLKNIKLLTKKFRSWVGKLSTKHDAHGDCPQPLYSLIQFPSDEVELKAVTFSKEVHSHGDEVFMPPFGSDGSRVGQCKKQPYFCSCANAPDDKASFPPNISQQDEIVISSAMYESESSLSIEPVQWYLEDPLPDVESLLVAVPDPPFYVSPPDTARSPPTTIIPMERAMQPGKKVTIVAPESKLANALAVLSSTAEDREIEVRISVGAPIKKEWEKSKSAVRNIEEMGLVYDPNVTFKIPRTRELIKPTVEEQDDDMIEEGAHPAPKKEHVAQSIEKEARAPRERTFRLPSTQVQWLSYLMDKHGDNYKAMARDGKNYYQDTWRQIRAKINRFKGIPEQYNEYLEKKKSQVSTIT